MRQLLKKALSIITSLALAFSFIIIRDDPVSISAAAHSQAEAVAWANAQIGQGLDFDRVYGNQCVDLIAYYYQYLGTASPGGNAEAYRYNALPAGWTRTSSPQVGDIAVWKPGFSYGDYQTSSYGHVGIVTGVNGSTITVVNQNFSNQPYCSANNFPTAVIECYIRPDWTPAGNLPQGSVDYVQAGDGYIDVRGWAFDKDAASTAIYVHVYIGGSAGQAGTEGHVITANTERTDVGSVYGVGNYHGFSSRIYTAKSGSQPVYIYAINVGSGSSNTEIGHQIVSVGRDAVPPSITDISVTDADDTGYTVSCTVSDNCQVKEVKFPTWSNAFGQDDIIWHQGTISDGRATVRISYADHGSRLLTTHIYAYDITGNSASKALPDELYPANSGEDTGYDFWIQSQDPGAPEVVIDRTYANDAAYVYEYTVSDTDGIDVENSNFTGMTGMYAIDDRLDEVHPAGLLSLNNSEKKILSQSEDDYGNIVKMTMRINVEKFSSDAGHIGFTIEVKDSAGNRTECVVTQLVSGTRARVMYAGDTEMIDDIYEGTFDYDLGGFLAEPTDQDLITFNSEDGTVLANHRGTGFYVYLDVMHGNYKNYCDFIVYQRLEDCEITLSRNEYTYDGTEKKPKVTVRTNDEILKEGLDYTVKYRRNIDAGYACAVVTALDGRYITGTATKYFHIQRSDDANHEGDILLNPWKFIQGGDYTAGEQPGNEGYIRSAASGGETLGGWMRGSGSALQSQTADEASDGFSIDIENTGWDALWDYDPDPVRIKPWSVQTVMEDIVLVPGHTYTVSFNASSSVRKYAAVDFNGASTGTSVFENGEVSGSRQVIELGENEQEYSYTFEYCGSDEEINLNLFFGAFNAEYDFYGNYIADYLKGYQPESGWSGMVAIDCLRIIDRTLHDSIQETTTVNDSTVPESTSPDKETEPEISTADDETVSETQSEMNETATDSTNTEESTTFTEPTTESDIPSNPDDEKQTETTEAKEHSADRKPSVSNHSSLSSTDQYRKNVVKKRVKITKIKLNRKSGKVTWKKVKGVDGYILQFSTSKKFKRKKKEISYSRYTWVFNLNSKKKYYFRVRSYVDIGGRRYYSKWSKVKSKRTK